MKKLLIIFALFLTSCNKNGFQYLIPEGTPYLVDIQNDYINKLIDKPEGWYLKYEIEGVRFNFIIKFKENGLCDITTDVDGFNFEDKDIRYQLAGLVNPELQFTSYSAFSKIFEHFRGGFEFEISENPNGTFKLIVVKGTKVNLNLVPATNSQLLDIQESARIIDIVNDFSANASAYFKNLDINGIQSYMDINMATRQLTISWIDANDKIVSNVRTFNYKSNGITFNSPLVINGQSISYLNFGTYDDEELELLNDSNVNIGKIYVSHVANITFPHAADEYMYLGRPVNFWAYVGDDLPSIYSPDLLPLWTQVRDLISPTMFRIQIYNNNTPTINQSIQFLCRPEGLGSTWLRYNVTNTKMGEDHVFVNVLGTHNTGLSETYKAQCYEILNLIFPPEGVTIMPFGKNGSGEQIFRVISRKNSRIYFNVRVGAGSPLSFSWD